MKEIGQQLKERRESQSISLEEVSAATKINIKILQSLEDGDLEKLPAKTFVRGFVQTYAKYLGMNLPEVMTKLQDIMGSTRPEPPVQIADPNTPSEVPAPRSNLFTKSLGSGGSWITGVVIVILILGIIIVQKVVSKHEAELKMAGVQAITGSDAPVTLPSPSITPTPSATPVASPSPSPSPTASLSPFPSPSPAHVATPKPSVKPPTPKETPKPSPIHTPPPAAPTPAKSMAAELPAASPTPVVVEEAPAVPQTLIIEALDNVSIKVSIDGKPAQDISLASDQIQTFKAKGKIKLSTSNGGAISVIHNGHEIGVPGNLGQPKTLSYP